MVLDDVRVEGALLGRLVAREQHAAPERQHEVHQVAAVGGDGGEVACEEEELVS